jgi:exodeoxyribonuclease-3
MIKVITCNTNGIRSAARKGFFDWLKTQDADVVCIQETKAQRDQLDDPVFHPEGYHSFFNDAVKKGYSGTAVYCKAKPTKVISSLQLWNTAEPNSVTMPSGEKTMDLNPVP